MRARLAELGSEAWLAERTGAQLTPACRAIEAVDDRGRIRGMVAFDLWTPNAAQIHVALESPTALRCLLATAADFIFSFAGKRRVYGLVPAFNDRSLQLARRIGFAETHRIRDGWSIGVDLVVFELAREDCRWGRGVPDVQQHATAADA